MRNDIFLLEYLTSEAISFTSNYQMPKVKPYKGETPSELISFNRLRSVKQTVDAAVHFYIDDSHFECIWYSPKKYFGMLRRCSAVLSTDYSVYSEMPLPQVIWNSYRNKILAAWMQSNDINVIPNVSWSRRWSYDFCFEGYPKNSVIAINSTGIGRDKFAKHLWRDGYDTALATLNPSLILRYGAKQEGEHEDISIYYPNDNFKAANYGRKWSK